MFLFVLLTLFAGEPPPKMLLAADSGDADAQYALGSWWNDQGRQDRMCSYWKKARDRNHVKAIRGLEEYFEKLEGALKTRPQDSERLFNAGHCYAAINSEKDVVRCFRGAVDLEHVDAAQMLLWYALRDQDILEAERCFDLLVRKSDWNFAKKVLAKIAFCEGRQVGGFPWDPLLVSTMLPEFGKGVTNIFEYFKPGLSPSRALIVSIAGWTPPLLVHGSSEFFVFTYLLFLMDGMPFVGRTLDSIFAPFTKKDACCFEVLSRNVSASSIFFCFWNFFAIHVFTKSDLFHTGLCFFCCCFWGRFFWVLR